MKKLSSPVSIKRPWRIISGFLTAFLLFASVLSIDVFILESHPLKEGIPRYSAIYLLRTLLLMASSIATVFFIVHFNKYFENSNLIPENTLNIPACTFHNKQKVKIRLSSSISFPKPLHLLILVLIFSITFIGLFLIDAFAFSSLCREDKVIEYATAIIFIFCSIGFGKIAWQIFNIHSGGFSVIFWISILLAFTFFLIGMEEISWFQRILKFNTTEFFEKNLQQEMNLHNFATREVENLFYFFSVVFFIIIPNVSLKWINPDGSKKISLIVPGIASFYSASVFIAYNYDMWNISLIQYGYYLALFIFIYYFHTIAKLGINLLMPGIILLIYISTQVIILITGMNQIRIWDFTEYKELFIALSFFIYCLEVFYRLHNATHI